MAQKAIREYFGKKLLYLNIPIFMPGFKQHYQGVAVDSALTGRPILANFAEGYIVKPDELFGKRGKNGLIFHAKTKSDAFKWIKAKSKQTISVKKNFKDKGISGRLRHFLIEPYVAHKQEYYLAIKTEREHDEIYFSTQGGVEIEEKWDSVQTITLPFTLNAMVLKPEKLLGKLQLKISDDNLLIAKFISAVYACFRELDFTYLEINPFTVSNREIHMLDLVARLDDTALYRKEKQWNQAGTIEFPSPFGSNKTEAELEIARMDASSGASLKFSILNPEGRIWMLTSGGGGSVIFADTVGDLGAASELGNYGEYSGNPSTDETAAYADIVIRQMLKSKALHKVLIIGGGIANFTDIKETFTGIIYALNKNRAGLKKQKVRIFVRRGGPNYKAGLELMKTETTRLGLYCEVYGPETYMTEVVRKAVNLKSR